MKNLIKYTQFSFVFALIFMQFSCTNELNTAPDTGSSLDAETLFANPASYKQFLAKLYAGLATTGQSGPSGTGDLDGIDEGFSQYIRNFWNLQELTTDEAIIAWNDATIKDFHNHSWTTSDGFLVATYARLAFQVTNCNEYLRQTTDAKLDSRGISGTLRDEIKTYRAEARFLRALSLWHVVDMFGGGALENENSPISYHLPAYASRADIFAHIEQELNAIDSDLKAPNSNEQYRVDKAAAWMLKAKLLMNAKVYVGTDRYADAMIEIQKIISQTSYSINPSYKNLFLADNNSNGAQNEIIFAIAFDGINTKTYGGTTYLTHAPVGGSMAAADFGINGGWAGIRTTSAFVDKFAGMDTDKRKQFYTDGQSLTISDVGSFTDGYGIVKFKNVTSTGTQGSDAGGDFVDTDFPMFRLADVYLMYVECYLRGAGGNESDAITYFNTLRQRAYGNTTANISSFPSATNDKMQLVLDERARELYWEGHRRTDLIRFGKFTGSDYLWPWKGNVAAGISTDSKYNLFPIPQKVLVTNSQFIQNTGY